MPPFGTSGGSLYSCEMARAKIWLPLVEHCDNRVKLRVGDDVALKVSYYGDRLYVNSWGGNTTVHGRLVGIEWHEQTGDQYGPGVKVETTDDFTHDVDDYAYELTVATNDWLPHG